MIKKFVVRTSLHEDIQSGCVWITAGESYEFNNYLKIENISSGKSCWIEIRKIDSNFISKYNSDNRRPISSDGTFLVISEWHRNILNIAKNAEVDLKLGSKLPNFFGQYLATLNSPTLSVRQSTQLGLLGLFLGILSIVMSLS